MNENEMVTSDYGYGRRCDVDVKTQIQPLTEQCAVTPDVIKCGSAVVKIPVVLAEVNITIPVEATIELCKEAMEIKRIKKNVYLTQSRIIPFSQDGKPGTGILFISGFIRKNIEYATKECHEYKGLNVCGDIKHSTVQVPFNFTTRVNFMREPIFDENTTPNELGFFTDEIKGCDTCADPIIGRNPCDRSSCFTEYFNEKPFTELVRADIAEVDITQVNTCKKERVGLEHENPIEEEFTKVTEKVVVNLTLKILQKQQVRINAL